jgi:hypothetical protein
MQPRFRPGQSGFIEIKQDGSRIRVERDGDRVRLITRAITTGPIGIRGLLRRHGKIGIDSS